MTKEQNNIINQYNELRKLSGKGNISLSDRENTKYLKTLVYLSNNEYIQKLDVGEGAMYIKNDAFDDFEENFRVEIGEPLPKILELYRQIDVIRNEFSYIGGEGVPRLNTIYTSERFIQWKNSVIYELTKLQKIEFTTDLIETFNSFNGWSDEKSFEECVSKLQVIVENYDDFAPIPQSESNNERIETNMKTKTPKVFISHAKLDRKYMELLVDLLEFIGLDTNNLICTSVTGYGVPLSQPIFDFLQNCFNEYELHVIFAHSHNFYSRPVCLNEMGAAWVAKSKHTSILLPNFNYSEMTGVVNADTLSIKLDDEQTEVSHRLDELYDIIVEDFGLSRRQPIRWEQKRNDFIKATNALNEKKDEFTEDVISMLAEAHKSKSNTDLIMRVTDLSGTTIQAGATSLNEKSDNKNTAKWEKVLQIAIDSGLVTQADKQGAIFKITHEGFELFG